MKKIIIFIFLFCHVAFPSFELDYQIFDSYRTSLRPSPFFSPDAIFLGYDFRSPNESMSTFVKMYVNPLAIFRTITGDFLSFLYDGDFNDHHEPIIMTGGGIRYRHKLFTEWHLDSDIGIYHCILSPVDIITPMLGMGIYNQRNHLAVRLHYIPYRKEFGSMVTDHYMLSTSFKF